MARQAQMNATHFQTRPAPPERALFIRFGGLGDILLATPTVRALARAFPGIAIDFIVGGGLADTLTGNTDIRRVWEFDKRGADARAEKFLPFLWTLRQERYDLVINLHPSAKSALMLWATEAPRQVTFQKRMAPHPETGRVAHAIDDFVKELAPLGIESVTDRSLSFAVPPEARQRTSARLSEYGVRDSDRLLVINPAASRPINRWPAERFAQIAAHFAAAPGTKVILTGAAAGFRSIIDGLDEGCLAKRIADTDTRILDWSGALTLKELGALLERANAFLTCDTGPMHMAAALETPMVVLSGAADPDRTGPLTAQATILIHRALPCVPCRDRVCMRGDVACMTGLTTSSVIAAIKDTFDHAQKTIGGGRAGAGSVGAAGAGRADCLHQWRV